jgi:hypothetical protein
LPLRDQQGSIGQGTALDLLPQLLKEQGIDEPTTKGLVKSFIEQEPLMEALHRTREAQ